MKLSLYVNQHDEVLSQAEVIEHLEQKLKIAVEALEVVVQDCADLGDWTTANKTIKALEKLKDK